MFRILLAVMALVVAGPLTARTNPAVFTDPPHDAAHPAKMAVIHIPSGGVEINGVAYIASGAGPHPVFVFAHGLPGNEKNLDLAQAVRRAGWTVVTFNYRGSWGSPGSYRFASDLEDVDAVLAYVRDPRNAAALRADPSRVVLAGHSLGGWATGLTAAHDKRLLGAVMISTGNIGRMAATPRAEAAAYLAANGTEALAGTTPEIMADEIIAAGSRFDVVTAAPRLVDTRLFVLTSDDGGAPMSNALVAAIRAGGGKSVTVRHVATDHSWSDARIRLASEVIDWLQALPTGPPAPLPRR
jgi:uncharacterized protein